MKKDRKYMKKGSRILAMLLAASMVISLGADVATTKNVYAAESSASSSASDSDSTEENATDDEICGRTWTSGSDSTSDDNASDNEETVTYTCGLEEHQHTAKCYTETVTEELICGKEEGEGATEGHTHTDACYEDQQVLVCGKEEGDGATEGHVHSDNCYDADGNLTCGKEEGEGATEGHTHTDACYETQSVLICGQEAGDGATEGHQHTKSCYKTTKELTCGKTAHTHTDACKASTKSGVASRIKKFFSRSAAVSYASEDGIDTQANDSATGVNMNGYITNASFQKKNGVIWEESTEFTTADQVRGTINFENIYTSTIKNNSNTIYIDLPAYIDCSKFTGTYDTYDGSTHSGKYTYQKNEDGTYRIVLKLDDDYVDNAGDTIGGSLQFNFQWTKEAVPDSGTKKVEIGNWSGDLTIKEDSSGDDKPSSANYSIYKQAGGLQIDDKGYAYIDYTVTLTVKNGMTAPINMKDVLTGEGFTYDSTISVTGGDVKVNFGSTEGQGTNTQIQLWPNNGSTVEPGTYTIKYRVKSLNNVTDPGTVVPSEVKNSITVPEKGDDSISSETHTSTTSGKINKQGQLVSGSDATYIDYTVYLNAGDIIKNLKTPANFTDTLPDTLELQGDVTVKQYDVTGTLQNTTTATVNGQNISYTTPTGQYYYVITYRTKVKDSDLPIGGSVTIKNDGKSTGGVDGSSSSEITVTNHGLAKTLRSGATSKDDSGKWIRTSNWTSNVAVKGDLEGYVYEDYSSLFEDTSATAGKVKAMTLVKGSLVVKDASGNVVSSDLYTVEDSNHTTSNYYNSQSHVISDGLFKITFKKGVTGPVSIEYQTIADMSKLSEGAWTGVTNYAELSKDGHTDKAQAQDSFQFVTDNKGLIYKKQDNQQWSETSGSTTLKPGENSIPWVILINRGHTMSSDFTVTDTIKDGLIFLEDTLDISINNNTIKNKEGVTWSYDKTTGKLTVNVKESAYRASGQSYTHDSVTISFRTQLPDSVIKGNQTSITYKNTASLETNGSITDSTYEQKVIREVVGKSGSYDKNTHILSYNVVINSDGSRLNNGQTLTVTDTLDAGSIAEYVKLHSLDVFTAIKTTDASGNVKIEPGKLVQELTLTTDSSAKKNFTYMLDASGKSFTTYLPDETAYVIVAKYFVNTDVTEAVQMKNTAKIEGNDDWKKEDSSTKVEANTSGETHTNKVTVVKHDTAQYSTLLAGASFELDKYENNAWTKVGDATTNKDGTASINPVTFNTLYKLSETQAPNGYVLDEGPTYFIVATEGTSEADAKKDLPESILGAKGYSKDAVKVYYAKQEEGKYINIEIDRYNSVDETKTEPGQIRVNKVWVDSKGQTVTDTSNKPDVSVTLTKVSALSNPTVTIKGSGENADKTQTGAKGGYLVVSLNSGNYGYENGTALTAAQIAQKITMQNAAGNTMATPVTNVEVDTNGAYTKITIGPINENCTIVSDTLANGNAKDYQIYWSGTYSWSGGTDETGTSEDVIGTVTLNKDNEWTYLWSNLDRSTGVSYRITETTVDGYTVSYKINGSELQPGTTFTPGTSGDKVTITNTANPEYELPDTGGTGTWPWLFGGTFAVVFSLLSGGVMLRRKYI